MFFSDHWTQFGPDFAPKTTSTFADFRWNMLGNSINIVLQSSTDFDNYHKIAACDHECVPKIAVCDHECVPKF